MLLNKLNHFLYSLCAVSLSLHTLWMSNEGKTTNKTAKKHLLNNRETVSGSKTGTESASLIYYLLSSHKHTCYNHNIENWLGRKNKETNSNKENNRTRRQKHRWDPKIKHVRNNEKLNRTNKTWKTENEGLKFLYLEDVGNHQVECGFRAKETTSELNGTVKSNSLDLATFFTWSSIPLLVPLLLLASNQQ